MNKDEYNIKTARPTVAKFLKEIKSVKQSSRVSTVNSSIACTKRISPRCATDVEHFRVFIVGIDAEGIGCYALLLPL